MKGPRRPKGDIRNRIYGSAWRKVRLQVLERDRWLCQIRLQPGCRVKADRVDHIVPPDEGGAWYDPANLRAACAPCNGRRVGGQRRGREMGPGRSSRDWFAGRSAAGPPVEAERDVVEADRDVVDKLVPGGDPDDDVVFEVGGPVDAGLYDDERGWREARRRRRRLWRGGAQAADPSVELEDPSVEGEEAGEAS